MRKLFVCLGMAVVISGALPWAGAAGASTTAAYVEWGMQGDNVVCVQFAEAIVLDPGPDIDGIFGDETYYATLDFQAFYSLSVDGVVGPQTGDWVWYWDNYFSLNDCYALVPTTS
jgi:hypothetical protein